eukprot:GFYU01005137.1.p1 GENE.GFYU01005137.1~~GFYU01005137.1.p1  ORF type:complete len:1530 (-),score=451.33 GFYU01005137.1:156-4745(-)
MSTASTPRLQRRPTLRDKLGGMMAMPNFIRAALVDGEMAADADSSEREVQPLHPDLHEKYCDNFVRTTKYTYLTFLPKNLLEQFMRVANFYFLVIAALQLLPVIENPLNPFVSIAPLVFVLTVTGVKEAYEDHKRRVQDNEINNKDVEVLDRENGNWTTTIWQSIHVGDIVRLRNNDAIPCDIVLLSTSETFQMCFVETSSLDGESNLKPKQALEDTSALYTPAKLQDFRGLIRCQEPNANLEVFNGTLSMHRDTEPTSLGIKQMLLRGCVLKNTKWVVGIAVYTGLDTKLILNSTKATMKQSYVERNMNRQVIKIFVVLGFVCTISAIMSAEWLSTFADHEYTGEDPHEDNKSLGGFLSFFMFLILYNVMVPISLYVSVEVVKMFQGLLINWDVKMYHDTSDTPAAARTSNLNEELGQVHYVFSDKTGTLTQNRMAFLKCSIGNITYGTGVVGESHETGETQFRDSTLLRDLDIGGPQGELIDLFLLSMAICHTVNVDENHKGPNLTDAYQASSPDDLALVKAAAALGYEFVGRSVSSVDVKIQGKIRSYELLQTLEFNSDRKRMSVVVRAPDNRIIILSKGADSVILSRLARQNNHVSDTKKYLKGFAEDGLRTLCFSYKVLYEADYAVWRDLYIAASTALVDRDQKIDAVAEKIETNLILIGSSAIEDKLQDGVPECIQTLAKANIHIWVLTGDKRETAINIGYSCGLLDPKMNLIIVDGYSHEDTHSQVQDAQRSIEWWGDTHGNSALIITGDSVGYALDESYETYDQRLSDMMYDLARACKAVVCCRVTPLQKKLVVDMVKLRNEGSGKITLAIGDGANDVSMIKSAHIGIGISGLEGLQAVRSSDYAIAQFRFLSRLLLVHGRYSYIRIVKLVLYSFYKNMAFSTVALWYAAHTGWSGQTVYASFYIAAWNTAFTAGPIVMLGVFDQDVPGHVVEELCPRLYQIGQQNQLFDTKTFWSWMLEGAITSVICFFIPLSSTLEPFSNGLDSTFWVMGLTSYACILFAATAKAALETQYWTWVNHLFIWGSVIVWFMTAFIYSQLVALDWKLYNIANQTFMSPQFWLCWILCMALCVLPNVAIKFVKRMYFHDDLDIYQEMYRLNSAQHVEPVYLNGNGVHKANGKHVNGNGVHKEASTNGNGKLHLNGNGHTNGHTNGHSNGRHENGNSNGYHSADSEMSIDPLSPQLPRPFYSHDNYETTTVNDLELQIVDTVSITTPSGFFDKSIHKEDSYATVTNIVGREIVEKQELSREEATQYMLSGEQGNDEIYNLRTQQHPELKELCLSNTNVGDMEIADIATNCPKLEFVDLSWCSNITSVAIECLATSCPDIRRLRLDGLPIRDIGKDELCDALDLFQEITDISLCWVEDLTDEDLEEIAEACPFLLRISLQGCSGIGDVGVVKLSEYCAELENIDLHGCVLVTDSALSGLQQGCPNLRILSIRWCTKVTDHGLLKLANNCVDLEALDLTGCLGVSHRALRMLKDKDIKVDVSAAASEGNPTSQNVARDGDGGDLDRLNLTLTAEGL